MKIPKNIEKIITKEGITFSELRDIALDAIEVVDDNSWKIIIDRLIFPIDLTNEEVFEFIEFFFLYEYDVAAYINLYYAPNEILVEGDKHFGGFMLALIVILSIGILAFIVIVSKWPKRWH